MNEKFDAISTVLRYANLRAVLGGIMGNKWWRKGSAEEDRVIADAAHELIEGIVNADTVGNVKQHTGIDLRDQVSVAEMEDWHRDRELRGFGIRRN